MRLRIGNQKGSVLVMVTLVTLVLAALVIVSLRNIARTVREANVYQTRNQSYAVSRSGNAFVSKRVGDKASNVYNRMTQRMFSQQGAGASADNSVLGGSRDMTSRTDMIRGGQWTKYSGDEFEVLPSSNSRTGLFTRNATSKSFEDREGRASSFRTIVRDPIDAQAATGFDRSFCFKKVSIVTEATVGAVQCEVNGDCDTAAGETCRGKTSTEKGFCDSGWKRLNTSSRTRSGIEGLIGPVECGYQ